MNAQSPMHSASAAGASENIQSFGYLANHGLFGSDPLRPDYFLFAIRKFRDAFKQSRWRG